MKPSYPDGQSIQYLDNTDGSYKPTRGYCLVNDRLCLYPEGTVANSWNPGWYADIQKIDCTALPNGRPMTTNLDIEEGNIVKCLDDSDLSRRRRLTTDKNCQQI